MIVETEFGIARRTVELLWESADRGTSPGLGAPPIGGPTLLHLDHGCAVHAAASSARSTEPRPPAQIDVIRPPTQTAGCSLKLKSRAMSGGLANRLDRAVIE
jgi:hypothetical protein